jgi:hypothetical protein
MNALLCVVAVLAAESVSAPAPKTLGVNVGLQAGFPHLVGVTGVATIFSADERPRFDVDLLLEPSVQLQSYSVGGAYHVLDSPFFVGARVRVLEYQPFWARGGGDARLGLGLELGGRFRILGGRGVVHVALFGTYVPTQVAQLSTMFGLSAGFSWELYRR